MENRRDFQEKRNALCLAETFPVSMSKNADYRVLICFVIIKKNLNNTELERLVGMFEFISASLMVSGEIWCLLRLSEDTRAAQKS